MKSKWENVCVSHVSSTKVLNFDKRMVSGVHVINYEADVFLVRINPITAHPPLYTYMKLRSNFIQERLMAQNISKGKVVPVP